MGVYQQRHVSYRHQSKETWQQIGKIFNLRKRKTHGARGTHITRDMCFPGGEHISLGICVSLVGEHISLGICVSLVGEHISLGICVSLVGNTYH